MRLKETPSYFSALSEQLSERLQRYKLIVEVGSQFKSRKSLLTSFAQQIERKLIAAGSQSQVSPQGTHNEARLDYLTDCPFH